MRAQKTGEEGIDNLENMLWTLITIAKVSREVSEKMYNSARTLIGWYAYKKGSGEQAYDDLIECERIAISASQYFEIPYNSILHERY